MLWNTMKLTKSNELNRKIKFFPFFPSSQSTKKECKIKIDTERCRALELNMSRAFLRAHFCIDTFLLCAWYNNGFFPFRLQQQRSSSVDSCRCCCFYVWCAGFFRFRRLRPDYSMDSEYNAAFFKPHQAIFHSKWITIGNLFFAARYVLIFIDIFNPI